MSAVFGSSLLPQCCCLWDYGVCAVFTSCRNRGLATPSVYRRVRTAVVTTMSEVVGFAVAIVSLHGFASPHAPVRG